MESPNKQIYRGWLRAYVLQLSIAFVLMTASFFFGRHYLFMIQPVWYSHSPGYRLLHFINDNMALIFGFALFAMSVILTLIHFRKASVGVIQIAYAVNNIYSGNDNEIALPSDFKHLEGQLRQIQYDARASKQAVNEANKRKNDMVMYMAHDLKTPLTSIIGYLSLLKVEKEISQQARDKYTDIAYRKALRLEELINGFFDIARYNFTQIALEKSRVNMSVMLAQILSEFEPLFAKKELTYRLVADTDIDVNCDVGKMERVFDNLLKNIAAYSDEKSEIEILLEKNGSSGMKLVTRNRGKTIASEMQAHIFEQFFRLDSSRASETGGSGLGLAVAKEIVDLHGGEISCKSENGRIEFCVILPGI